MMKKINLGDIEFIIHNKREELFLKDLQMNVETLRKYILNPDESLSEYNDDEREHIIKFRLATLNGKLSACFWMNITKNSYSTYVLDDFKDHFINA